MFLLCVCEGAYGARTGVHQPGGRIAAVFCSRGHLTGAGVGAAYTCAAFASAAAAAAEFVVEGSKSSSGYSLLFLHPFRLGDVFAWVASVLRFSADALPGNGMVLQRDIRL